MDTRYVNLQGTYNFRDIGGYKTKDNRRVKQGLLYRSDELCYCTKEDGEVLTELGIKSIIDYRNEKERKGKEDISLEGVEIYYLDPKADAAAIASSDGGELQKVWQMDTLTAEKAKLLMTKQNEQFVLAESSKKSYRRMLDIILDETKVPMVQHCRGGKDRTGYGAALILLLLGVEEETVLEDYMLTNYYKKEKNEKSLRALMEETGSEDLVLAVRYLKEANREFLLTALALIRSDYGTAEAYARQELSMTTEELEKLRGMYLEGE